jgi:mycofactocin precursor
MPDRHESSISTETGAVTESLVEQTLVEEVSIDGMCGVY